MRSTLSRYYEEMTELSRTLVTIFELALKVPLGTISSQMTRPTSILSLNHYPPLPCELSVKPGQLRLAKHTDLDLFTIVAQDGQMKGLEIGLPQGAGYWNEIGEEKSEEEEGEGNWLSVPPVSGALVVNIGDGLMYWTNDRWKSTPHRVALPPTSSAEESRYFSFANVALFERCTADKALSFQ